MQRIKGQDIACLQKDWLELGLVFLNDERLDLFYIKNVL